ncbi:uncharacterized protein [Henckelia pumila]|uniref:uncharacterized protein n=1 Tax=Henckelia pumila TaxID=405737 RepID=UPI003C6E6CC6
MVGSMKFDIEKFTGKNDFSLGRIKMHAILIQHGLVETLKKKEEMSDEIKNKDELLEKAHSAIILCLGDRPLREVAREESVAAVWLKLENLCMTKSLANRLYMKQRLYSFKVGHLRRDCPEKKGKQQEKPKDDGTLAIATNGYDSAEVLEQAVSKVSLVVMKAVKKNLLYVLQGDTIIGSTTSIQEQQDRTKLWHLRLGHVSEKGLHELSKQGLLGGDKIESLELCDSCALGKSKRVSFGQGNKFVKLCKEKGITRHRTVTGTPQQNGLAERMNRTLLERVRCMLINASLPKSFWVEALSTACYLVNRYPSSAIGFKTPMEKWSGTPADYSKLRVFGYGKDSQISVNDKLPIEVESSVPDEEADEMQDDDMIASDPKDDLSTYNLARDRTRREIRAPKRFGEADLAWYALTVAGEVEYSESNTYDEAMASKQKTSGL